MKTRFAIHTVAFLFYLSNSPAQVTYCEDPHIPVCHTHENSICFGYAMGRAYAREAGDPVCDPRSVFPSVQAIDLNKFDFYAIPSLIGMRIHDIVAWGYTETKHVAFITYIPTPVEEDAKPTLKARTIGKLILEDVEDEILVDQVGNIGAGEVKGLTLAEAGAAQGPIRGYYRRKDAYSYNCTFSNSFDAGDIHINKSKNNQWKIYPSGFMMPITPGSLIEVQAIDGQTCDDTTWRYSYWTDDKHGTVILNNPHTKLIIEQNTYTAYFVPAPPPPTNLRIANTSYGVLQLAWNSNQDPSLLHYEIWRYSSQSPAWQMIGTTASTSFTDNYYWWLPEWGNDDVQYKARAKNTSYVVSNFSNTVLTKAEPMGKSLPEGEPRKATPSSFDVCQNYPNPFNPSTQVSFALPEQAHVRIAVFDLVGREVAVLLNASMGPGYHSINWNAQGQPSGTYICRFSISKGDGLVLEKTINMTYVR